MAVESYRILGTTLAMRGQLAEAERMLRDALALPGAGAYTTATLGWVLARAGKLGEAEQLLGELEAAGRDSYVSPVHSRSCTSDWVIWTARWIGPSGRTTTNEDGWLT